VPPSRSHLESFLSDPRKSTCREYLLTTRLVHDLTVAAAERSYDLLVYLPAVDSDGFDVIFDDRDRLVPIQLKSVVLEGKTREWKIRRSLLRPEPEASALYGFESSPNGTGRGGGVILTRVAASGDGTVSVCYSYTDIDVLSAIWLGILPCNERLRKVRAELETETTGSVMLPRSAFFPAASPEHLLALCGLHSRMDQPWRWQLRNLLRELNLGSPSRAPNDALRAAIRRGLEALSPRGPEAKRASR